MTSLLPLTISIKRTEQNAWGIESTSGVEKFYRAHVDYDGGKTGSSADTTSEEGMNGTVIFIGEVEILDSDILIINGEDYTPKDLKHMTDLGGNITQTMVYF
jgi:hypothetical protein